MIPVGGAAGAFGAVKSIFGGGPPDRNASRRIIKLFRAAQAGDTGAAQKIAIMAQNQGSKFKNINRRAVEYAQRLGVHGTIPRGDVWDSGGGAAPAAGKSKQGGTRAKWETGAPAAPRNQRPCAYGPRGQDGYCPKRMSTGQMSRGTTARNARPCAYGPRGADGYCPKRGSSSSRAAGRIPRSISRRAETAGGNLAAKYGAAAAAFIAKTAMLAAAGYAAYWLTSKLRRLRFRTWDELRTAISLQYKQARRAAGEVEGRGLTPAESSQLSQWYKAAIARTEEAEDAGRSPRGFSNLIFGD